MRISVELDAEDIQQPARAARDLLRELRWELVHRLVDAALARRFARQAHPRLRAIQRDVEVASAVALEYWGQLLAELPSATTTVQAKFGQGRPFFLGHLDLPDARRFRLTYHPRRAAGRRVRLQPASPTTSDGVN